MNKIRMSSFLKTCFCFGTLLCFGNFSKLAIASEPSSEASEEEELNVDDLFEDAERLDLEEEEEIEGDDTAMIYQEYRKKIADLSVEDRVIKWEVYLKKYPNSIFKERIQEEIDQLQDEMFSEDLSFDREVDKEDGDKEIYFTLPMQVESIDPRTKVRFGFEMGLPQYINLIANYEHQIKRDLSVHAGIRKRYTGWNLEVGSKYAFVKSARTNMLVTGLADIRFNANPGFPAFRPQIAAGKRFFLPNDFFLDAQAQLGTDLLFYQGLQPILIGGFNVTFAPSETIRVFLEGSMYMKEFAFEQGPFAFNTVTFGMKVVDKNTPNRFITGVGASVPAYYKYWLGHFGAIMGDINLFIAD